MIPKAFITAWRAQAPWASDAHVEQDLVLSRAVVEIFSDSFLKIRLAMRGGTAFQKLFLKEAARYSEDIDLVQVETEPIGEVLNRIRSHLDAWLGIPRWDKTKGNHTLVYKFQSENRPIVALRLKLEINTREHFTVLGFKHKSFRVENPWYSGQANVQTYALEELMGTKLRALYQRQKGRDLFDLAHVLKQFSKLNPQKTVTCFLRYLENENHRVSRAEFESNMLKKLETSHFRSDITPLLRSSIAFNLVKDYKLVHDSFIRLLPGEPWKGHP